MQTTLVVVRAFGGHAIGDLITNTGQVSAALASEHASYVVQMVPPSSPSPSPAPIATPKTET